jgi:hypothetical protein
MSKNTIIILIHYRHKRLDLIYDIKYGSMKIDIIYSETMETCLETQKFMEGAVSKFLGMRRSFNTVP